MVDQGWGRVISISSTAGKTGEAFASHYCAAKRGLIALSQSAAPEVAPVTVNCVCPGFVETPMTRTETRFWHSRDPGMERGAGCGRDARPDPARTHGTARGYRLGQADATDEQVLAAASAAMLDNEGDSFPDGLDTLVGERGITLSGGQKQRVAFARAILRDPSVLVLDDATSSLDAETERDLLRGIRESTSNRTVLMVTHRVSSAMLADRVAVVDGGEIVDVGAHQELLDRGGLYARMHERQRIEEELAHP